MSDRPLEGRRIVVTRAREQAGALAGQLVERGAVAIQLPTIRFEPPDDWGPVDLALGRLDAYDWIIFTSANGVSAFFERLAHAQSGRAEAIRAQFAAIGPATCRAIEARGYSVDFIPSSYVAEAVVAEMAGLSLAGQSILLPRAREARDVLGIGLEKLGARVDEVAVYQTRPDGDAAAARRLLDPHSTNRPEVVTLTSSSTARQLVVLLGDAVADLLHGVAIASIGPITSQTARELGLTVAVEASEHTIPGLVRALELYFSAR